MKTYFTADTWSRACLCGAAAVWCINAASHHALLPRNAAAAKKFRSTITLYVCVRVHAFADSVNRTSLKIILET